MVTLQLAVSDIALTTSTWRVEQQVTQCDHFKKHTKNNLYRFLI